MNVKALNKDNMPHVVLVEGLHVHANVVTRQTRLDTLVVHLHGEHLASACIGSSVGGEEHNFLTRLDRALLDTASEHITDTLDLVHTRECEAHGLLWVTLGWLHEVVESILEGGDMAPLLLGDLHFLAIPPAHVGGLLEEVVTHPTRDWDDGHTLLNELLGPANLHKHELHLRGDLIVTVLLVAGGRLGIHLVHAADELLDTEQVDETSVLTGLTLHLTSLVVTLLDGNDEVTVSWHHEDTHVSLGGAGNHVLDEVTMARGIDDGVVVVVSEELLGGALDGHTTLALVLLGVHVEGEGEGALTDALGLLLELLHVTLGDTSELEEQAAGGGRLARVDVTTDDNGHVSFLRH